MFSVYLMMQQEPAPASVPLPPSAVLSASSASPASSSSASSLQAPVPNVRGLPIFELDNEATTTAPAIAPVPGTQDSAPELATSVPAAAPVSPAVWCCSCAVRLLLLLSDDLSYVFAVFITHATAANIYEASRSRRLLLPPLPYVVLVALLYSE
jgi:hypothetical protein